MTLAACGLLLVTRNPSRNFWVLFRYAAGSVPWSSRNHGSRSLCLILFFIVFFHSCYAGLSFKSGYQQTGYIHPILSYGNVKYYYCLLLVACCLLLVACCLKLEARFRLAPCYLKTRLDRITAQVWSSCRPKPGSFNRALRPRRFILVSACNFSADQPATRPENL